MTSNEINILIRPYLLKQKARRDRQNHYLILSGLLLCIMATAFALILAFVLHN